MWISREPSGLLVLSIEKPRWIGHWYAPADATFDLPDRGDFPDVTFENSPQQVELRYIKASKKQPIEYVEFEGVVKDVHKHRSLNRNYAVLGNGKFFQDGYTRDFALKPGIFTKATAPKVGDRVVLSYRKTKKRAKGGEYFDFINAKIIKVI